MPGSILIIQHAAVEGPGLLSTALEAAGLPLRGVRAWLGDPVPRRPEGVAGLVVLGGPMAVYEAAARPHLGDEIALVAEALAKGLPVLGICLGAQILAAAAGARVFQGPEKEIGWSPIRLTGEGRSDPVSGSLGLEPTVFHWHGDTFDLPGGAVLLASSDLYEHQAFRLGPSAYGLQFHVEVTPRMIEGFVEGGAAEIRAVHGTRGAERLIEGARRFGPGLAKLVPGLVGAFLRPGGLTE